MPANKHTTFPALIFLPSIFLSALSGKKMGAKKIDAEGLFGSGEERKQVVVNLLMGDQSDEDRLEFAERVNPPESVEMLRQDLEAADRLES